MEDDEVLSLNRPESQSTNPPGHLWRDKWTALGGPLSVLRHGCVSLWQDIQEGKHEEAIDHLLSL